MIARLAAVVAAAALAGGCSRATPDMAVCHAGMPQPAQLLADPVFASLAYKVYREITPSRPWAYAIWADSRFEYVTALEYVLVPARDARDFDDLCANAISMRFTLPAGDEQRRKVKVFARAVAPAAGEAADTLERRILSVLDSGDKMRLRGEFRGVTLEAGQLVHPSRGEFFIVTFTWPAPAGNLAQPAATIGSK